MPLLKDMFGKILPGNFYRRYRILFGA